MTAVFDVRITDTDCPSSRHKEPHRVLASHEQVKKKKYLQACLERRRQFTPLVYSVDGMMGKEAQAATKQLAFLLAAKWNAAYSNVCGYVKSRQMLVLVRTTSLCLHSTRDPTKHGQRPSSDAGGIGLRLYQ